MNLGIYFILISWASAFNSEHLFGEYDPTIEPLELVLRSDDVEGNFYCHSHLTNTQERRILTASIEHPVTTMPTFFMKTEQINTTTLRIRIRPNGYIGINQINCYANNNSSHRQIADLIVGVDKPGIIQLKERCLAYDRRYIECIFRAPIFARAFLNGFPRLFRFNETNAEPPLTIYRSPPKLVRITNESELVFHFEPKDRTNIPKKTPMVVSMTLRRFNSSIYYFNMEPLHTTNVSFQIEAISSSQLTIRIDHNNTKTISSRICSGQVSQVDEQDQWITIQEISETTDQSIVINKLRSSRLYEICLRCFYESTDYSSKEPKCIRIQTKRRLPFGLLGFFIIGVVLISVVLVIGFVWIRRKRNPSGHPKIIMGESSTTLPAVSIESFNHISDLQTRRYTSDPVGSNEINPLMEENTMEEGAESHPVDDDKYRYIYNPLEVITDRKKVAPDTVDLTQPTSSQ